MLELEYKKKTEKTKQAMIKAIENNKDYYNPAKENLSKITKGDITILNSANSCILTVVEAVEEPILTVDMGGWNGLERSATILNKKVCKIKTNNGVIDPEELEEYIRQNPPKTMYITALAAYTTQQPLEEISQICRKHNILLIVDISGTLGDKELSNPEYADIQIASTGTPKIINIENGGFINNITNKIKLNNHLIKTFKADNITLAGITNSTYDAEDTLNKTRKENKYLKDQLNRKLEDNNEYEVIFKNSTHGINTIITAPSKSRAKKVAYNIRKNIKIKPENKSIITTGPNYNRIKKPCVCIEIKNISRRSLNKSNMDKLVSIIINAIKEEKEEMI